MIGIILATHGTLGEALIETTKLITKEALNNIAYVTINVEDRPETIKKQIRKAIAKVDSKDGVIILTDMFGGTPSNISNAFLKEKNTEVISGVNLPILVEAVSKQTKSDFKTLSTDLVKCGKRSISKATGILNGEKRGV